MKIRSVDRFYATLKIYKTRLFRHFFENFVNFVQKWKKCMKNGKNARKMCKKSKYVRKYLYVRKPQNM